MLNTLFKETGLQLVYVREEFYGFLPLNTVQYTLADTEGKPYFLVLSFDALQDFYIEREQAQVNATDTLVWSGVLLGRKASLYHCHSAQEARMHILQQRVEETVAVDVATVAKIKENFLAGFPAQYARRIQMLAEFQAFFNALWKLETVAVGTEEGYLAAEQIGMADGEPVTRFCSFGRRYFQPVGYDEFLFKKFFHNKAQPVRNRQLNLLKDKLLKAIQRQLLKDREPVVSLLPNERAGDIQAQFALNDYPRVYPNNENYWLEIAAGEEKQYLPVSVNGGTAQVGTWMNPISRESLLAAVEAIFRLFRQVKTIQYQNTLYDTLLDHGWRHNDFYLPLPDNTEELKARLASKSRYNLRREKRIIAETFGGLSLEDVPCTVVPEELKALFYSLKNATHGVSEETYDIGQKPITNVYLLRIGTGEVKGMALSCEQGEIVFLENHTFDSTMRSYSFGQVLYDMYLDAMVEKGKTGVALAGGELEYKKRYGTQCAIARSGGIHRAAASWLKAAGTVGVAPGSRLFRSVADKLNRF